MSQWILKTLKNGKNITVADVQVVLLAMLKDVDAVCSKHKIPYFLNGGSALGAVRHQGFIPWDDDVDIAMLDSDFKRFVQIAQAELGVEYTVSAYAINKCYNVCVPAMKIRKNNTEVKEVNFLLKNKCKDGDGLFIDVFVYSHLPNTPYFDLPFRLLNQLLMPLIVLFENIGINPIALKEIFMLNASLLGNLSKHSDVIGFDITWTFKSPLKPFRFLKSDIYPLKRVPFEDTMLPVANNVDAYLKVAIAQTYYLIPDLKYQKPKHIVDISLDKGKL